MWRPIVVIVIIVIILIFAAQNMHSTQVNFPFTKGFQIRTVFLLILSFILGYAMCYFVGLAKDLKNRNKRGKRE